MNTDYIKSDEASDTLSVDFASLYQTFPGLRRQAISRRILVENLVRHQNLASNYEAKITAIVDGENIDIAFRPARVLMQDYAGMPALIDLAALRSMALEMGVDPNLINPKTPADLVIDHSVMAHVSRRPDAFQRNLAIEFEANEERYVFLKWAQQAFKNLRIVPPGQGIVHQVNTEYLTDVIATRPMDGPKWSFPDTVIGTDSHTTMVNGLGVLGWGVGGIEAEAVMLGEPVSMTTPSVVGVQLLGTVSTGILATDIVLSMTEFFRAIGVVGKIIEFCGPGVTELSAADRLTIANMAPEFGATAAFFPVDDRTLDYLRLTGRDPRKVIHVETYLRANGLFFDPDFSPVAETSLKYNLSDVRRVVAGPKRPHERRNLSGLTKLFPDQDSHEATTSDGAPLKTGDIVLASITSCTNTSNPEGMIAAGLLARKARKFGLSVNQRIKTSLAPGSRVVADYLKNLDLLDDLSALGFDLVAFGCTTCVGNSGELNPEVSRALQKTSITVSSVLSGNRNFEGRIHPQVKANFLASPPLVIAYALAGTMNIDLESEPISLSSTDDPVMLSEIWPTIDEIEAAMRTALSPGQFRESYSNFTKGDDSWASLAAPATAIFPWSEKSTYLRQPPFFELDCAFEQRSPLLNNAKPLLILGDFVTTDHISPVARISEDSPAAAYLKSKGINRADFNAYGARRGEHEIMARGTFAHLRLENSLSTNTGGWTQILPDGPTVSVFEAAEHYRKNAEDIVVLAGEMYGAGSARDWAAKGTRLLGVKAVIARSFERIHRANLVRMGVLPLTFTDDDSIESLSVDAATRINVETSLCELWPLAKIKAKFTRGQDFNSVTLTAQIETEEELAYLQSGGILPYVAKSALSQEYAEKGGIS